VGTAAPGFDVEVDAGVAGGRFADQVGRGEVRRHRRLDRPDGLRLLGGAAAAALSADVAQATAARLHVEPAGVPQHPQTLVYALA